MASAASPLHAGVRPHPSLQAEVAIEAAVPAEPAQEVKVGAVELEVERAEGLHRSWHASDDEKATGEVTLDSITRRHCIGFGVREEERLQCRWREDATRGGVEEKDRHEACALSANIDETRTPVGITEQGGEGTRRTT